MGEGPTCGSGASWTRDEVFDAFEGCVEESPQALGCMDKISNQIIREGFLWISHRGTMFIHNIANFKSRNKWVI